MRFLEVQKLSRWILIIVVPIMVFGWYALVQQIILGRPFGNDPGPDWTIWLLWAATSVLVPLLMIGTRLIVSVDDRELLVRWYPWWTRRVRLDQIESCEPRRYRPILDYGGWGIRYGGRKLGWAYTIRGSQGLFVVRS